MARRDTVEAETYWRERERLVAGIRQSARTGREELVSRPVLDVLMSAPRERFVPPRLRPYAYDDRALPIGLGQTLSQPTMVAWMTSLLDLHGSENVLEIGTGSGFQAYILSRLLPDGHLTTIERHAGHARRARRRLRTLGALNIDFFVGDGSGGYPPRAPFDRILVTAGAPAAPERLVEQIAPGGRMVIPIGPRSVQMLTTIERDDAGQVRQIEHGECVFVPLVGAQGWETDADPAQMQSRRSGS